MGKVASYCAAALLAACSSAQPAPGIVAPQTVAHFDARTSTGYGYRTLLSFNGTNGANPRAGLTELGGNLYGTTYRGGSNNNGTVYEIEASGVHRVVHSFAATPDGALPKGGLVAFYGNLYGTTEAGGTYDDGTVFAITPTNDLELTLHSFQGSPDGQDPRDRVVVLNGTLYGTTFYGGRNDRGAIFSVTLAGAERVLYSFGSDGLYPAARLTPLNQQLFGITEGGGINLGGTAFQLRADGTTETIHYFDGGTDGALPRSGMVLVGGEFYGNTNNGGTTLCGSVECGMVYALDPNGNFRVVYAFTGGNDGANPRGDLIYYKGFLYGTTMLGGAFNKGTVFSVTPSGTFQVLHAFSGKADGKYPVAGLAFLAGKLYGTTGGGGTYHQGTVYELDPEQ